MAGGSVTGVQEVIRALKGHSVKDAVNIQEGLEKCAQVIYRKSQGYVPVDTEALKKSGKVVTEGTGFGARAYVTYGGQEAPYALYVHEDLQAHHAPPTCAKYLERAERETRGTCASIMKRQLEGKTYKIVDEGKEEIK